MTIVHLIIHRRAISWAYVQHARGWDDKTLQLAEIEAKFNGYSPAMYLPLDEYILVQHQNVVMEELDNEDYQHNPTPHHPSKF